VTEPGQPIGLPIEAADALPENLWDYDFPLPEDRLAGEMPTGLVDLGFLGAALRRSKRVWVSIAAAGLLVGIALFMSSKPSYAVTTAIMLKNDPSIDPQTAMATASEIAQEPAVAQLALKELGLPGNARLPYTVTIVDNQVLSISLDASTRAAAVAEAEAVADAFLQVHNQEVQSLATDTISGEGKQLSQDEHSVKTLDAQINRVIAEPTSTAQQQQLTNLQAQRSAAESTLASLQQQQSNTRLNAADALSGSMVMSTSQPVATHSRMRIALEYVGGSLLGGLIIGLAIVVIRALLSDRLYRRDDVAVALSTPVRVSVLSEGGGQRPLSIGGGAGKREEDLVRVAEYLRNCVPASSRDPSSLAVVAVDDPAFIAAALDRLIGLYVREGKRVAVADLAGGAFARNFGVSEPGIRTADTKTGRVAVVVLPDPSEVAPIGPRGRGSLHMTANEEVVAMCSACDVLLTLAVLDPAVGADHLTTWADEAVAVVTAGKSSVTRVQAAGEMIRDAGARLTAGILLGADKKDESLGLVRALDPSGTAALS
jgi:hypothetical protein